jgi:hypothetical protein
LGFIPTFLTFIFPPVMGDLAGDFTFFGNPAWGVDAKSATSEGAIDPAIWADGLPGVAVAWPFWTAWARFMAMDWFRLRAGLMIILLAFRTYAGLGMGFAIGVPLIIVPTESNRNFCGTRQTECVFFLP